MPLTFRAEVFQNPYLPQGAREVHAIMTVTAEGSADPTAASSSASSGKVFAILCDTSGSMQGQKIRAAKEAMIACVNTLPEDVAFFLVTGAETARVIFPVSIATPHAKQQAISLIRAIDAHGGTAISTWLAVALAQFQKMPGAIRQALLLTDGENDGPDEKYLDDVLRQCEGVFQCDCRGVGTDWRVQELKRIGDRLLGTTDIIPQPAGMAADFRSILDKAVSKNVSDVALRLWTPVGARVLYCKEVSPEIVDLTGRARLVKPQLQEYPTGAWGKSESRDYHFAIEVKPGQIGDEMLAGRASLVTLAGGVETKVAEARILAVWTDDEAKSTRIDQRVAHYTGQAELATSIQQGLEARARGDEDAATSLLGKAVKLAHDSGNESTAKLLRGVVDVLDAPTGTIKLKRNVAKEDEMMLETRSTKTRRLAPTS